MADVCIQFQAVSFAYDRATQRLIQDLSIHFTRGWTGIVGANGAGKSTILKLATGSLRAQEGRVPIPESAIYCRQRIGAPPEQLTHRSWRITREGERTNTFELRRE